ncbi:EAL domain-containing protein [Ideonella sp. A 288]|uniref:EAL domain-containing protein n=1 Tax=Ideonella sp. A 288 TaxID=1962181 RepID=UPI000B4AE34C|nr:EAL domain-containing protein [Ideonella sp. A 288]
MSHDSPPAPDTARWKVLLVDDEPAVHEVSRLILADLAFEGRELEVLSAGSAAQARELMSHHADVALVLLDVVMETDDAGVALVQYIRGQLRNSDVQIVLRTGQPGMAPEREVVLRYEINGYCLKTDVTSQRLHSIVVSALRAYRYTRSLRAMLERDLKRAAPPGPDTARSALALELVHMHNADSVLMQAQPEVALASNQVSGIELVPQWKTSLGLLPAERVRDALPVGPARRRIALWLLSQACFWARSWRATRGAPVTVSIPLVADSLGDCGTLEAVLDVVRDAALPRGALDLLVGEATWLGGHPDLRGAAAALRELGVTLTLVDFGAQTISLQRLNQLVPDRLKIHRLFVRGVSGNPEQMAIARSLIALAQTLSIQAIADGVSSDSDAQFFKWEGCDLGQGDTLAPACAPADVAAFLQDGRKAAH